MSKFLELFKESFDDSIIEKTKLENKPYVAYSIKEDRVVYTVVPKPVIYDPYVTFKAEQDNSSIGLEMLSSYQTLEYSTDTTTWNTFDTTTKISLNNGDKVYVRGMLSADNGLYDYTKFKMSGKIAASGNCNAIWNYQDLNAPIKACCGLNMFYSCALTTAPELPATELADWCYSNMFYNCTSLTTAPELPATTLAEYCYSDIFSYCTSLTTSPELPATTLANSCYSGMFRNCTSLTTAPELPATMLVDYCYKNMFNGCTSLTTSPELPATTLVRGCYYQMFYYCTNLNHIECLATDISATECTKNWVNRISSTGTFVKHPNMTSWSTGSNGIPTNKWEVVNAVI